MKEDGGDEGNRRGAIKKKIFNILSYLILRSRNLVLYQVPGRYRYPVQVPGIILKLYYTWYRTTRKKQQSQYYFSRRSEVLISLHTIRVMCLLG